MKCIRLKEGKIIRVSDKEAAEVVKAKLGKYTTKGAWKAAGRPR